MSAKQSYWKAITDKQVFHYIEAATRDEAERLSLDHRIAKEYESDGLQHPGEPIAVEPFDLGHPADIVHLGCYLFQTSFFTELPA